MKYFDTHAHLNSKYFKEDSENAITEAKNEGVLKIVIPGTTIEDSLTNISFAKKHEGIYPMIGIHPADAREYDPEYLTKFSPDDIVGVGEVGLDFYHEDNPSFEIQKRCFVDHIEFAVKHNKPLVIHMRNSEKEVYEIIKEYKNLKFALHCYSGNVEWANKFIDLGAYISLSGIVTFKNAKEVQEVAKIIPRDRIIAETDSPFLAPTPHRGKGNKPAYVKNVVDFIAELRNDKEMINVLYKNSMEFFGL